MHQGQLFQQGSRVNHLYSYPLSLSYGVYTWTYMHMQLIHRFNRQNYMY